MCTMKGHFSGNSKYGIFKLLLFHNFNLGIGRDYLKYFYKILADLGVVIEIVNLENEKHPENILKNTQKI